MESQPVAVPQQTNVLTVLVADDNAPTRMLLRAAIKQWGYSVVEAADGEQAWEMLQQSDAPRLLVVDWLMPKLDGTGLSERIRRELPYHPYIILLTQMSGTENIIKGLEAGADEFLSKPFNMAELRSRLSVGARIINNEIALAKQGEQLQYYIAQMKILSADVNEMAEQINTMINSPTALTLQSIQLLQAMLEKIVSVVNKFQK
jgi:DNA-binding response OmpR family regulator